MCSKLAYSAIHVSYVHIIVHEVLAIDKNYTLSKKISIIGTLGSGWDHKFYMGTQNGSNYEL